MTAFLCACALITTPILAWEVAALVREWRREP